MSVMPNLDTLFRHSDSDILALKPIANSHTNIPIFHIKKEALKDIETLVIYSSLKYLAPCAQMKLNRVLRPFPLACPYHTTPHPKRNVS